MMSAKLIGFISLVSSTNGDIIICLSLNKLVRLEIKIVNDFAEVIEKLC